jgi:hypothetical protein
VLHRGQIAAASIVPVVPQVAVLNLLHGRRLAESAFPHARSSHALLTHLYAVTVAAALASILGILGQTLGHNRPPTISAD